MVTRKLDDLVSVGPATVNDLHLLGIFSVDQLSREDPVELYKRLCKITGERHDPCCEDIFSTAVAQAQNAELPPHKKKWSYWSKIRKSRDCAVRKKTRRKVLVQSSKSTNSTSGLIEAGVDTSKVTAPATN